MKRKRKGQSNLSPDKIRTLASSSKNSLPAARDPLKTYLEEISRYGLMSKEEEQQVAKKMQSGDRDAAKTLVMANLRLVVKIAFEYKSVYQNVMDLIQEGNIGLMKAISMYNPKQGAKLSYYASWWIRSYILKFLIDNFRLVRIGTTQAQKRLFYNLIQEQRKLENQGLLALPESIGRDLGVSQKDVLEMSARLLGNAEISMDQPINSGDNHEKSFSDVYQDNSTRPDLIVEEKEKQILLAKKLKEISLNLNDKEKVILKDRLLSDTPSTLQEIANKFGISKERTRQLEERILKRLKQELSQFRSEN